MNKMLILTNEEDCRIMRGDKLLKLLRQSYIDYLELVPKRIQERFEQDWYDNCQFWNNEDECWESVGVALGNILRVYYSDDRREDYEMSSGLRYINLNPRKYYMIYITQEGAFQIEGLYYGFPKQAIWYNIHNHTNPKRLKFKEIIKTTLNECGGFYWKSSTENYVRIDMHQYNTWSPDDPEEYILTIKNTGYGDLKYVFKKEGELPDLIRLPKYYYSDEDKLAISKMVAAILELLHINTTIKIVPYFRFEDRILSVTEEKEREESRKRTVNILGKIW